MFCEEQLPEFPNTLPEPDQMTDTDSPKKKKMEVTSGESTTCDICHKTFKVKTNMVRHKKNVHGVEPSHPVRENVPRRRVKQSLPVGKNYSCPDEKCQATFNTQKEMRTHLTDGHHMDLELEVLKFPNLEEFKSWKEKIEKETKGAYIIHESSKRIDSGFQVTYYYCHRYTSKSENFIKLISAVKQFPVLYDKKHPNHTNSHVRLCKWKKVAKQCNFKNYEIAQKKWKHLRDYYRKLLQDEEAIPDTLAKSSWPYKEQMDFLREASKTDSYVVYEDEADEDEEEDTEEINEDKRSTNTESDSLLSEYLKKKQSKEMQPKDSLRKFFEYAESSVRAMSENRQIAAKAKISEILMRIQEEELGEKTEAHNKTLPPQNTQVTSMNFPLHPQNPSTSMSNMSNARFQYNPQSQNLNLFTSQEIFSL